MAFVRLVPFMSKERLRKNFAARFVFLEVARVDSGFVSMASVFIALDDGISSRVDLIGPPEKKAFLLSNADRLAVVVRSNIA